VRKRSSGTESSGRIVELKILLRKAEDALARGQVSEAKRRAELEEKRNLPALRADSPLFTALSEHMGAWTLADELYLQASGILLSALKQGSLNEPKTGRAYAVDGVQTVSLELNQLGFQIEIKVDGRGTQWDYQPQGWFRNSWETDNGGYHVSSIPASTHDLVAMIERLNELTFVCDQAYNG
jgi:hypothetical protein